MIKIYKYLNKKKKMSKHPIENGSILFFSFGISIISVYTGHIWINNFSMTYIFLGVYNGLYVLLDNVK